MNNKKVSHMHNWNLFNFHEKWNRTRKIYKEWGNPDSEKSNTSLEDKYLMFCFIYGF